MPALNIPLKGEIQTTLTNPSNPKPSMVRIRLQPSVCTLRRPRKITRQIIRQSLRAPSIAYSQHPDGSFQLTRQHPVFTEEDDDHLYFARGHLSRVTSTLREEGYQVRLDPAFPNELQYVALRKLQKLPYRRLGEHIERSRSRLLGPHQWPSRKIDHECPRALSANHHRSLQQVGVSEDSPLGKQALWTVAASPLGQLIFHDESRRLTTLGHLLSILPSTQTWVVCRNHQDANDLETQVRKFERKHRKRYQIPCGGVASRGLGSVHILPVSGIHKIPLERQNISSLRPKTGYGAVLPRLLIFWEAELACQKRVLKLCQHLNLDNTSRFLFSMSRNTGHQFDEMVVEQMCGPIVWHEAHGWFWPELGMESLSGG